MTSTSKWTYAGFALTDNYKPVFYRLRSAYTGKHWAIGQTQGLLRELRECVRTCLHVCVWKLGGGGGGACVCVCVCVRACVCVFYTEGAGWLLVVKL